MVPLPPPPPSPFLSLGLRNSSRPLHDRLYRESCGGGGGGGNSEREIEQKMVAPEKQRETRER